MVQPAQPIHADRSVSFASAQPSTEDVVLAELANASISSIAPSDNHLHSSSDSSGTVVSNESNSGRSLPTGAHACQLDIPDATSITTTSPISSADVKIPIVPVQRRHRRLPLINLGPDRRQYANPIAYLGGPRIDRRNVAQRSSIASSQGDSITSINSIMSLD